MGHVFWFFAIRCYFKKNYRGQQFSDKDSIVKTFFSLFNFKNYPAFGWSIIITCCQKKGHSTTLPVAALSSSYPPPPLGGGARPGCPPAISGPLGGQPAQHRVQSGVARWPLQWRWAGTSSPTPEGRWFDSKCHPLVGFLEVWTILGIYRQPKQSKQ